jgi:thymidine phosphorylase
MSAFLMPVFLNGMDDDETFLLTVAMIKSGDKLGFSFFGIHVADKHSSGGVGDGISLIVVPYCRCKYWNMHSYDNWQKSWTYRRYS